MNASEISIIKVYADGGCRGNGTENAKCYGSFMVKVQKINGTLETVKERMRFDLDLCSTNNQAEYAALNEALFYLLDLSNKVKIMPQIQIFMDSELVVFTVNGSKKCKEPTLRELRNIAAEAMEKLVATLSWIDGDIMKGILGH